MFHVSIRFARDYPVKLVYKRPHIVLNPDKEVKFNHISLFIYSIVSL